MGGVWSTSEIGTTRIEYLKGRTLSEIAKFARRLGFYTTLTGGNSQNLQL